MANDVYVLIEHLRGKVSEISYVMLAAGRILAQSSSSKLNALMLGSGAEGLAADFAADQVLYFDNPNLAEFTPDAYVKCLEHLIETEKPRAFLLGHTSIGMEVANILSIKSQMPLVSSCIQFTSAGGILKFTSQLYGGKILVEGDIPGPSCLLTVVPGGYKAENGQSSTTPPITNVDVPELQDLKVKVTSYIEPEAGDVDITSQDLLIAVGRGVQLEDNIELAEELAQVLSGVVCASRPVVDQGWMPTSRLVGKSGFQVKPKVYIALGISGAPEHTEGMAGSDTIIAINTDPAAPIFNIAKYGVVEDLLDLVPLLTEKIEAG